MTILNLTIEAGGSEGGSAIGTGVGESGGISGVGNIAIWNTTIVLRPAEIWEHMPTRGIRTGDAEDGKSSIGLLSIFGSHVEASLWEGSEIGTGSAGGKWFSSIGNMSIWDSVIKASG
jgi:hypothetical protein